MHRIFLLSPAHSGGERAKMLLDPRARFDLARKLQRKEASLGEAFAFLSGLYFRGKLAYAKAFAKPPDSIPGIWVITSNSGLLDARAPIDTAILRSFSEVEVNENEPRYRLPLMRTARRLRALADESCEAVLLGSVATGKYVDVLLEVFGEKLLFPTDFVGRGDMSRGGLMLRSSSDHVELSYSTVLGAIRRGKRPPKLTPRRVSDPRAEVESSPAISESPPASTPRKRGA